jgi:hypothetical protein
MMKKESLLNFDPMSLPKKLPTKNHLAYFAASSMMKKESFITLTLQVCPKNYQ